MIRIYIKAAFKSLVRNKFYSAINILGLTLGITVCLLILMYIFNELSYERFQINREKIFRIAVEWGTEGSKMKFAGSMPALAPAINSQVPEVLLAVRIRKEYDAVIKNNDNLDIKENNFFFADSGVFNIFSFNIIKGNPVRVLSDPYTVVISEKVASKYFGTKDPLGKELMYRGNPLKITGIMENIPLNTHLNCDFLVSYSTLNSMGEVSAQPWNSWGDDLTYIIMKDGVPANTIIPKLNELLQQNAGTWLATSMKFEMQPLKSIHWDTSSRGDVGAKGNKTYIYIFLSAAIFVMVIACFNFLNLSISQYLGRLKEIGLRKTAGSMKRHLVFQFMTESTLLILISSLLAVLMFDTFYLQLYSYLGTTFVLSDSYYYLLFLIVISFVILVGAIAGGYPAFFISGFNPIEIFRRETPGSFGKVTLRRVLVIFQFTISIVLLAGTSIIYLQLDYMKNSDPGFSKQNGFLINMQGAPKEGSTKYEVFKEELLKNPDIISASGAFSIPGINSQMNMGIRIEGASAEKSVNIQVLPADYGFALSLGLKIIKGRDFSKEYSSDRFESVLLNETAVSYLGLTDPIGTKLMIAGEEYAKGVRVVGVVKDFHVQSYRNKINPVMIYINPKMFIYTVLRINPQNTNKSLQYVKKVWDSVFPGISLNYTYLDDVYNSMYRTEEKTGFILTLFTGLALFISCLGLFGFASFIIAKKVKEVGIRKVLGAQTLGITLLFSGKFVIWIVFSGVIATPVAYLLSTWWLQNFAFHITPGWWVFLGSVVFELLIAFSTVIWLTWSVATRNPVEALRYE